MGEDGHEARFVGGALIGSSVLMGTIDSLAPNDTVKAFGWLFIVLLTLEETIYELVYYPQPKHPREISLLLMTIAASAYWGIWNLVYFFFKSLEGQSIVQLNGRILIMGPVGLSAEQWWLTTVFAVALVLGCYAVLDGQSKQLVGTSVPHSHWWDVRGLGRRAEQPSPAQ